MAWFSSCQNLFHFRWKNSMTRRRLSWSLCCIGKFIGKPKHKKNHCASQQPGEYTNWKGEQYLATAAVPRYYEPETNIYIYIYGWNAVRTIINSVAERSPKDPYKFQPNLSSSHPSWVRSRPSFDYQERDIGIIVQDLSPSFLTPLYRSLTLVPEGKL